MSNMTRQTMCDRLKMRGDLTIHVRNAKTGRIIRTIHEQNVITDEAGNVMRTLLAQRATDFSPGYYALGSMRFGTNNTIPTRADTILGSEVVSARKQLLDTDKSNGSAGELELKATLLPADANGNTLREVAMFTTGASWNGNVGPTDGLWMFNRQIHAPVEKSIAITLEYNWAIQFTV